MYDIDIHLWNLKPFRNLKFLIEILSKKCVFLHFFNNKCIIIYFFKKKQYHIKEEEILLMGIALFFNFFLFGNVSWITNMRPSGHWKNVTYFIYIDLIQSSSSNYWIKISFDSKWTLSSKMLSCKIIIFILFLCLG
jgi:hypothetical protein